MAKIGVGIVGCGHNGLNHANRWQEIDEARIIGVCDIDEKAAKDRAVVQVTLNCNGTLLRGQERAVDHFKAVDSVAGVLQRQTQRLKAKLYRAEQRGLKASEQLAPPLSMEEEPLGQVVRKKRFVMQSMSPEEAILEMELVGHGFFMFLNSKTQEHNVVYRRSGGDYGLIEPEAL